MLGYYQNGVKNNVLFKQLSKRSPNTILLNDSVSETAVIRCNNEPIPSVDNVNQTLIFL